MYLDWEIKIWIKKVKKKCLTSFTVSTLKSSGAAADARRCAAASVHALRVAQRGLAVLAHVALRALADFVQVAPPTVSALFVAFGVWPCAHNWWSDTNFWLTNSILTSFFCVYLKPIWC